MRQVARAATNPLSSPKGRNYLPQIMASPHERESFPRIMGLHERNSFPHFRPPAPLTHTAAERSAEIVVHRQRPGIHPQQQNNEKSVHGRSLTSSSLCNASSAQLKRAIVRAKGTYLFLEEQFPRLVPLARAQDGAAEVSHLGGLSCVVHLCGWMSSTPSTEMLEGCVTSWVSLGLLGSFLANLQSVSVFDA